MLGSDMPQNFHNSIHRLICKTMIHVCSLLQSHSLELLRPIDKTHEEIYSVRGINSQLCGVIKGKESGSWM